MAFCSHTPTFHIFAVVLGSLEIILFGGVIFGWHSVVYVYKDTGYFAHLCPSHTSHPPVGNITWQYHTPAPTGSAPSHTVDTNGREAFNANIAPSPLHTLNVTSLNGTDGARPQGSSIRFEELSCEEKIQVRSDEGVSQVCTPQDEQFNLIFSLATGINGILSFPSGILYDRLGTRISRIVSIVSFVGGQFFLIFASSSSPYLLYPGFIGLVYGGYQVLLTNLQLSCLIPSLRSTIMSLYSGSYDTSSSIFLLFKTAHEGGVSINTAFAIQATLFFLILTTSTFCLLPKNRIPFPVTPGYRLRCFLCHRLRGRRLEAHIPTSNEWRVDPNGSIILTRGFSASRGSLDGDEPSPMEDRNGKPLSSDGDLQPPKDITLTVSPHGDGTADNTDHPDTESAPVEGESMLHNKAKEKRKTFRQVALSPLFLTDLVWMSVQRLRSWIFVGMFNPWITRLACGDKALVSHYTSVYAGLQFFGILTAPLSGRLMDRRIKGGEKYGNPRFERLHASMASFVLNSTVSILLTICTLIPVLKLQYLTFALHCLHRSFLYGPNSAFVANGFPNEHFGKLFGVTLTVSAMFSMLQYPLFLIMQGPLGGDPLAINVFLLVLMLLSYVHPFYIWRYLQKKLATAAAAR